MNRQQVARNHQKSKNKTPLVKGILQRAAVSHEKDDVRSQDDHEAQALMNSAFSQDYSKVPITATQRQKSDRTLEPSSESIQAKEAETPNQTGLPDNFKDGVEKLSGYSLDDVRVHYNSPKPAQLQALAYTQGTDIHIAPGQAKHLPHEAWHVIQQKQGRVKPTMQMKDVQINDDQGLEREADVMGAKVRQYKHIDHNGGATVGTTAARHEHNRASSPFSGRVTQPPVYQLQTRVFYAPPNYRPGNSGINNINHSRSLHNTTQRDLAAYHSGYATHGQAQAAGALICNHHVSYAAIAGAIINEIHTQWMNPDLDEVINWVNNTYNPNRQGARAFNNGNFGFNFGGMPQANIPNLGTPANPQYDEFTVEEEIDDIIWNLANDPQNLFYWPATTGNDPDRPVGASGSPMANNLVTRTVLINRLNAYRTYLRNAAGLNLNVP